MDCKEMEALIRALFGNVLKTNEYLQLEVLAADSTALAKAINTILSQSISILDTKATAAKKENFHHGLMIGLLRANPQWSVRSNIEAGDSFSNIIVELEDPDAGVVLEVKYASSLTELDKGCAKAMQQILERDYAAVLRNEGRENITAIGIAFWKKRCKAVIKHL